MSSAGREAGTETGRDERGARGDSHHAPLARLVAVSVTASRDRKRAWM